MSVCTIAYADDKYINTIKTLVERGKNEGYDGKDGELFG